MWTLSTGLKRRAPKLTNSLIGISNFLFLTQDKLFRIKIDLDQLSQNAETFKSFFNAQTVNDETFLAPKSERFHSSVPDLRRFEFSGLVPFKPKCLIDSPLKDIFHSLLKINSDYLTQTLLV